MATVGEHKPKSIDVKISFLFSEKPSAALFENVRSFIASRAQKSIFLCASDISTQADITILLRTVHYRAKGTVASTLRAHFKTEISNLLVSKIIVVDCNDIEKESLGKSECPSIEKTDAASPSCQQDTSIREGKDIGSCASKNGSVASQVILESQDIGSGVSQSIGSGAQSQSIMARAVMISFRLESWKADMPAEALLQLIRLKASEAVIDVTNTEENGLGVKIKCVWKNPMYPTTVRRHIQDALPAAGGGKIQIHTIDTGTVRAAYNNTPLHTAGRRWLQYSLENCAAYEMTLSELASGLRASAVDEQERYLACITRNHFKADGLRKLLLITNLADAIAKRCSDSHAHGPSTKAQIDQSSIQQARAGTESVPVPMPASGAPPATSSASNFRRSLVFSSEAGAVASEACAVSTGRGSALVSMDAASAGMIMTSLILMPRCRADSCEGFIFGQNVPRNCLVRKKAVQGQIIPKSGAARSRIKALIAQHSPLQKRIELRGVCTMSRPFQHPRLLM